EAPGVVAFRIELLEMRIDLANLLAEAGQPDAAADVSRRAWAAATEGPAKLPATPEAVLHLLKLRNHMAFHAQGAGRADEAGAWFREAAAIGERLVAERPNIPDFR